MKHIISRYTVLDAVKLLPILFLCLVFQSCEEDLPEAGSIPDATPPEAQFSFTPNETNYKEISFANLSISATDYAWDFGDGTTSTEKDPTHTYVDDQTYTVTLKASDKLGVENTLSLEIEIVEPVVSFEPTILNAGFDIEGDDDYRDNWRNGDLGGVIQITTGPIHDGIKAAKLPSAGDRIGYQLITVEENTSYTVSFYYTIKTSPVGSMFVSILAGDITNPDDVAGATLGTVTLNDQSDASTMVAASVSFNSGSNTQIAIYFGNEGAESRIDSFSISED